MEIDKEKLNEKVEFLETQPEREESILFGVGYENVQEAINQGQLTYIPLTKDQLEFLNKSLFLVEGSNKEGIKMLSILRSRLQGHFFKMQKSQGGNIII